MCLAHASWRGAPLVLLVATVAHAQPTEPSQTRAELLFEEGKALLREKRVDPACEKLEASQELEPAVGTLGLLAYCRELQGRLASARLTYLQAADFARGAKDEERAKVAEARAAALEPQLSKVKLDVLSPAPGQIIRLAGQTLPRRAWSETTLLDSGPVRIVVTAPGRQAWSVSFELAPGAALSLQVPSLEEAPSAVADNDGSPEPSMVPGLAVTGVGVALIGVSGYLGLRAISLNDDSKTHCVLDTCDPEGGKLRSDARTAAWMSTASFGLGLVAAGVGAVLLVNAGGGAPSDAPRSGMQFKPTLGPRSAGLDVRGVF